MALLDDIRHHLAVMNPGQRERRGAVLLREAAAEVERLWAVTPSESDSPQPVCPYVTGTVTRYCTLTPFTLTDAEREAIQDAVQAGEFDAALFDCEWARKHVATLRGLLERTSTKSDTRH